MEAIGYFVQFNEDRAVEALKLEDALLELEPTTPKFDRTTAFYDDSLTEEEDEVCKEISKMLFDADKDLLKGMVINLAETLACVRYGLKAREAIPETYGTILGAFEELRNHQNGTDN